VDVRAGSPTFGTWEALTLSADNDVSVYIPSGCAHGFLVMSDGASVQYKVTSSYNPEWDGGIRWDDADVEVDWPIINPIVSEKDMALPTLKENIKEGWIQK
jgi:dTDP-4-dehydrorhamnose 3,5-epimerase